MPADACSSVEVENDLMPKDREVLMSLCATMQVVVRLVEDQFLILAHLDPDAVDRLRRHAAGGIQASVDGRTDGPGAPYWMERFEILDRALSRAGSRYRSADVVPFSRGADGAR
ncbi:MAG: hypothetical protein K2X07_09685 [Caulobacteraceae bacterium]|nr:hypothetical protein [Caulobacteraceae bacterium]